MDICFNTESQFTRWVVRNGYLEEPFVVIDVGVRGGESVRWHLLGDRLVVHGFDAVKEAIDELKIRNTNNPNRHYHWIAAGKEDGEQQFLFNVENPLSSSFQEQGESRYVSYDQYSYESRTVQVRKLDSLLDQGAIPKADFLKVDVEGFETYVLMGAQKLLRSGVLGLESEASFNVSPIYKNSHFVAIQELVISHHLVVFDLNFNRLPRAAFQRALRQKGLPQIKDESSVGKPNTLNVLFCRDLIGEAESPHHYGVPPRQVTTDQLIKAMIIYESHGLNDIAVDTAVHFREQLRQRFDVDNAIRLLADPDCRLPANPLRALERSFSWRITAPLRAVRRVFVRTKTS